MEAKKEPVHLDLPPEKDEAIRLALNEKAVEGRIACAALFNAADKAGISPDIAGAYADILNLKIIACQLGLFGYGKKKKRVAPLSDVPETLKTAIYEKLKDGCLPCASAWEISSRMNIPKTRVSGACESLGIHIKPCQLGAF